MTTPTQAQNLVRRLVDAASFSDEGGTKELFLEAADALTAAARVGEQEATLDHIARDIKEGRFPKKSPVQNKQWDAWYSNLPADLKQRLSLHDFKRLGDCFAAAQVGESPFETQYSAAGIERERNATIERCAQELEKAYAECDTLTLLHGAARLRAMKNKPSAQVGAQRQEGMAMIAHETKLRTIERCAQALADYWKIAPFSPLNDLLAAIRKLKDEP